MARKTNFTREMSNFYRSRKQRGLTNKQIASEMGISTSTLYRLRNKQATVSARIENQFKATTTNDDFYFTTFSELQRLAESSNPRTKREAKRAIDKVQKENPNLSPSEIEQLDIRRPTVWRTVTRIKIGTDENGEPIYKQVKPQRVGVLLGRSKQEEQREQVKDELRRQGVDPNETDRYYNEALQMSEGR